MVVIEIGQHSSQDVEELAVGGFGGHFGPVDGVKQVPIDAFGAEEGVVLIVSLP